MKTNYLYPSIFNDVIGPVMRGPSSSHCAAALRIGRMARDLMEGDLKEIIIRFHPKGSIAHTHRTQGSDMGLFSGFLGWDANDERLKDYEKAIKDTDIKIKIEIKDFNAPHPNTYKLTLKNSRETHEMTAISSGGGMIEILEIDSASVSMAGDYYETLIYFQDNEEEILNDLKKNITADHIITCKGKHTQFIQIKAQSFLDKETLSHLHSTFKISNIKELNPVLPILARQGMQVPFITCEEMLDYNQDKNLELWELALHYESARGNITAGEVFEKMYDIAGIMKKSILEGIQGTEYEDRVLGYQSGSFKTQMDNNQLLDGGILNRMILYTTAMMEVKSSMGVIVACPTAGSCAALPGACFGAADSMALSEDDVTKALLAAGMVGIFIAAHATFAAEVGGCQAECGAASGMAAAALVTLAKGNTNQAIAAASTALQNIFGMVCDPVANRVEVPCLGKNVMAASNALSCANMALANFDPVIPLDEVINAMDKVGKSLPYELRCTALGGLSVTKTSKKIEKQLKEQK
ncbi:MAG: L-serine ammonia-lyase, iron-sulfur-dependent, subunit alpha [Candidatus Aminicenantes bacterium]|nr:MAG: L-serine ammonia-lyase, iron-sulfur-dependent, subunit alpha [Candidatus Aminicenantes bacterium]